MSIRYQRLWYYLVNSHITNYHPVTWDLYLHRLDLTINTTRIQFHFETQL